MIYSRKITLALKLNPTMFQVVNQKSIGAFNTIFGPSIKAVLTLSSKTAEMASILPTIIGASSDSRNVNFQDLVLKHLKNSTVEVPAQGYELETGWEFSLNDPIKRDAIFEWAKKNSINTDIDPNKLEKAIFDAMLFGDGIAVHEENLYMYMTPIKPQDYIIWRLALLTSTVANKPEDVEKSTNIRFYLHSIEDVKRMKDAKTKTVVNTATKLAQLFTGDEASYKRIRNMLICNTPADTLSIIKMEHGDLQTAVAELSQTNADAFISLFDNKNVEAMAQVYKLLAAQVITKDGDNYFDTVRPEVVLGSSVEGVMAYLAAPENVEYKAQLFTAYKASVLN